jgi:DNA-binding MarR family transcriptional regulator
MELLRYLREHGSLSGRQLAKNLKHDQKNIYTEIKLLSRLELLVVDAEGKYIVP